MTTPPRGEGGRFVRVRAITSSKANALAAYDELRRSGRVDRAMVLASLKDGSLQVLGQGMALDEMAQTVLEAAHALAEAGERTTPEQRAGHPGREPPPAPPPPEHPLGTGYAGVPGGVMNDAWRGFAEYLLQDAPEVQRQEMRRAFYAGAQTLLGAMMKFLDPGDEPTDADMDRMTALAAELDAFGKAVAEGKA